MATVTSQPVDADNTPDGAGNGISQARNALTNDENYCNVSTNNVNPAHHTAVFSDWDDIASGLPSNATITGVQVELPEYYGNVSSCWMRISINGGSDYGNTITVDLSGMQKAADDDVISPASETELHGLTWDVGSLNWDNVWVLISVDGGTTMREFYFDYIRLKVHYDITITTPKVLSINGSLTLNGKLTIK